ncbi:hypothetical protein MNBD_ACTINO01-1488 [hydrothermal vent metagenome]|uniref:CHAD domain-containing protein n=1 Tax=hydrothermal vent metagenome TaxID=652676 RepID=A0A3B0SW31_9ZZZZ
MPTDPKFSPSSPDPIDSDQPPAARFALGVDEDVGAGLRRIVIEQIWLASWHVQRVGDGPGHVHEFRKATKRIRAVLRLVRREIGPEPYRTANAAVRDVAKELSGLRTAIVRIETLEDLIDRDASLGHAGDGLSRCLTADAVRLHNLAVSGTRLVDTVNDRLGDVRGAIEQWSFPDNFDPTSRGLQRTYERGRKGMSHAYGEGTDESFHRWRKEVKYLRHQIEVLRGALLGPEPRLVATLEELGDGLGVDHDLADLEHAVSTMVDERPASRIDHSGLATAIGERRRTLHDDLVPLGESVYTRRPCEFRYEMAMYWRRWEPPIG